MSLILRSFLRDPRPLSRAIRRLEDDWLHDWPAKRVRRAALPAYEHPFSMMEDMSRQMASTFNRMQEFVQDMEALDEFTNRLEDSKPGRGEAVVRRTESGGLQLALDVADFKPEDLKIKLVDDHLVVEAENESSGRDSYRKSHFKRWFRLPEDCKIEDIKSKLTDDDKLVIDLPLNKPIESQARTIPIEMAKTKPAVSGGANQQQQLHSEERSQSEDGDARQSASS